MTALSWKVHFVSDLTFIHIVALLQIALTGWILYYFLRNYFQNHIHAFLTTILILTLPGFQIMTAYAGIVFHVSAILLASLSAFLVYQIPIHKSFRQRIFDKYTLSSILLLWMSLSTYSSTAMFFWVFLFIVVLSSIHKPEFDLKRRIFDFCFVGILGLISYALTLKSWEPLARQFSYGMYNPYKMDLNFIAKIRWFFKEPFLNSLNLWNVFPSIEWAVTLLIFILLTAVFNLYLLTKLRAQKFDLLKTSFSTIALAILLGSILVLSFLPSFLAKGEAAFYRCTIALSTIIILTVVWSLNRWFSLMPIHLRSHFLTAMLTFFCFIAVLKAYNNVLWLRTYPSKVECEFVKDKIKSALVKTKHIHFIQPAAWALRERYDEFITPTTRYDQDMVGVVTTTLVELSKNTLILKNLKYLQREHLAFYAFMIKSNEKILAFVYRITSGPPGVVPKAERDILIIDMNELYQPGGKLYYLTRL